MSRKMASWMLVLITLAVIARADDQAPEKKKPAAEAADPPHPWQPHLYRMYGFGISQTPMPDVKTLAEMGVNFVIVRGGGFNLASPRDYSARQVERIGQDIKVVHDLGMKACTGTVMIALHFAAGDSVPAEMLAHCVRDKQGKPYPDAVPAKKTNRELWLCVRDPYWQERFSKQMVQQASLGYDCSHIDQGHAAVCYCNCCRQQWQQFSRQRLGQAVPLEEAVKSADPAVRATYAEFRYDGVVNFVRRAHQRINAVRPGFGIDTTDHIEDRSLYFWTHGRDAFDLAAIELTAARPDWFPPLGESLTSYRLARACLGPDHTVWCVSKHVVPASKAVAPGVTEEEASTSEGIVHRPRGDNYQRLNPSPDRQRLYLAQGLAEGVMVNPQSLADVHARNWGTRRIPYDDIIESYYKFQKAHENQFRSAHSVARVAVLFSAADAVFQGRGWQDRPYGLCETLVKAHIPYDVRVLEYPGEIEASRYQAFIIPSGICLSDAAVDFLASALATKKTVITFGPLGQRDENFIVRSKPLPPALKTVEILSVKPETMLYPFNAPGEAAGAAQLAKMISDLTGPQIVVTHANAGRLAAIPFQCEAGAIVHLLNYNIPTFPTLSEREQLAKERVVPAESVSVTVKMPSAATVKAVRGESPDHQPALLAFQQRGDTVSLTVPQVGVWEVIFIDTAPRAGATAGLSSSARYGY